MTVVLGIGVILTEIFAPQITRLMFHNFKPAQLDLCVRLTRVLLPAQIFFTLAELSPWCFHPADSFYCPPSGH